MSYSIPSFLFNFDIHFPFILFQRFPPSYSLFHSSLPESSPSFTSSPSFHSSIFAPSSSSFYSSSSLFTSSSYCSKLQLPFQPALTHDRRCAFPVRRKCITQGCYMGPFCTKTLSTKNACLIHAIGKIRLHLMLES